MWVLKSFRPCWPSGSWAPPVATPPHPRPPASPPFAISFALQTVHMSWGGWILGKVCSLLGKWGELDFTTLGLRSCHTGGSYCLLERCQGAESSTVPREMFLIALLSGDNCVAFSLVAFLFFRTIKGSCRQIELGRGGCEQL